MRGIKHFDHDPVKDLKGPLDHQHLEYHWNYGGCSCTHS